MTVKEKLSNGNTVWMRTPGVTSDYRLPLRPVEENRMEIGGAKFDIGATKDGLGPEEDDTLALTVLVFGINSLETVHRVWENTYEILRDIDSDIKEDVPTGKTKETKPPPATSHCRLPSLVGGEHWVIIGGAKFDIGITQDTSKTNDDVTLALKVVVFGMDTKETVERVSENMTKFLRDIDPSLELAGAIGEERTIN